MLVSERIKEKIFEGITTKDAYLNCCKWLSTNVIAINNSQNVTFRIEKINADEYNKKVKLTLYVSIDEGETYERHCNICKEFNSSFFVSKNKYQCEVCKMPPYRKRLMDRIDVIKESLKGKVM